MADWPSGFGGTRLEQVGAGVAPTSISASASANTKGSWTQLTASSPIDADGFYVYVLSGSAGSVDFLFDIGVGAAASEQVILENVLVSMTVGAGDYQPVTFYVPLPIKSGTRIAARFQSSTGSKELYIQLQLAAGDFFSQIRRGRATTYGANTADSGGTSVDPGAVANTKGSWSELLASLTNPFSSCLICVGNQANAERSFGNYRFDIGVGAAASEQVLVPDCYLRGRAIDDILLPAVHERFAGAKSGQRLAARAQSDITDATDRLLDIVVIGFD